MQMKRLPPAAGLIAFVVLSSSITRAAQHDETKNGETETDHRPHLVMLIAEREYRTAESLPMFAKDHLQKNFRITVLTAQTSDPNRLEGIDEVRDADVLLISVRRRTLPTADLDVVRKFVADGKPVIGIRTASHAFSLRKGESPAGCDQWPEFDAEVFGGHYHGHYANDMKSEVFVPRRVKHPIITSFGPHKVTQGGSLYRTAPLAEGTTVLLLGKLKTQKLAPEPVAWTFQRKDGGRSFYTSLGHVDDFRNPLLAEVLKRGIFWAAKVQTNECCGRFID